MGSRSNEFTSIISYFLLTNDISKLINNESEIIYTDVCGIFQMPFLIYPLKKYNNYSKILGKGPHPNGNRLDAFHNRAENKGKDD